MKSNIYCTYQLSVTLQSLYRTHDESAWELEHYGIKKHFTHNYIIKFCNARVILSDNGATVADKNRALFSVRRPKFIAHRSHLIHVFLYLIAFKHSFLARLKEDESDSFPRRKFSPRNLSRVLSASSTWNVTIDARRTRNNCIGAKASIVIVSPFHNRLRNAGAFISPQICYKADSPNVPRTRDER